MVPEELVEDATVDLVGLIVEDLNRANHREGTRGSGRAAPVPLRGTQAWTDALADAVESGGDGLIDAELRVELIAAVLEGLEGADTEGLGAPYTEDAAGTVDWILEQLSNAGTLAKRSTP